MPVGQRQSIPPLFGFKDGICLFNSTPKLLRWPREGFSILSQVWYVVYSSRHKQ